MLDLAEPHGRRGVQLCELPQQFAQRVLAPVPQIRLKQRDGRVVNVGVALDHHLPAFWRQPFQFVWINLPNRIKERARHFVFRMGSQEELAGRLESRHVLKCTLRSQGDISVVRRDF